MVGQGDRWRLLSFAFQTEFLPELQTAGRGVHMWRGIARDKVFQVMNDDVKRRTDQWINVLYDDESFVDGERQQL